MKVVRYSVLAVLALAACLDNEQDENSAAQATTFIALDRDFVGFETWQSFDLGETIVEGLPYGRRVLYVSAMPPAGASEFPIGTKLVKVFEDPELPRDQWDIYAMVKRGGGFNGNGAVNWEWFELVRDSAGQPSAEWRGTEPRQAATTAVSSPPTPHRIVTHATRPADRTTSSTVRLCSCTSGVVDR